VNVSLDPVRCRSCFAGALRLVTRGIAAAALCLALSGCVKEDVKLRITTGGLVNGTFSHGLAADVGDAVDAVSPGDFDQEAYDVGVAAAREILAGLDLPAGSTVEFAPYVSGRFQGQTMTFKNVPGDKVCALLAANDPNVDFFDCTFLKDKKTGNIGVVFSFYGASEAGEVAARLGSPEINVQLTFPGRIVSTNGKVKGKAVTWTRNSSQPFTIRAVSKGQ
jgi:hypothetical protein